MDYVSNWELRFGLEETQIGSNWRADLLNDSQGHLVSDYANLVSSKN